jgi:hypothetical protein
MQLKSYISLARITFVARLNGYWEQNEINRDFLLYALYADSIGGRIAR